MGILTKLFIDASDKEFKLAQDLVAIAIADGEISEAERKAITEKVFLTTQSIVICLATMRMWLQRCLLNIWRRLNISQI